MLKERSQLPVEGFETVTYILHTLGTNDEDQKGLRILNR